MKLLDAYQNLEKQSLAAIETRDIAGILGIDIFHAAKIVERLAKAGLLVFVKKGMWAFPSRMSPLLLPRYCGVPFSTYVSLQTALYQHDMIMQVPAVIYAVSLARTKTFETALGSVSLHHIAPSFFFGFDVDSKTGIAMATPEKALLDFLYLSSTKTHLFARLPELEFPKGFSRQKAQGMIQKIPSAQRRNLVQTRFDELVH